MQDSPCGLEPPPDGTFAAMQPGCMQDKKVCVQSHSWISIFWLSHCLLCGIVLAGKREGTEAISWWEPALRRDSPLKYRLQASVVVNSTQWIA